MSGVSSTKKNLNPPKIKNWFLKMAPLLLLTLIFGYFIADILTSAQTYHLDADRTVSQILLIALTVFAFLTDAVLLVPELAAKRLPVSLLVFVASFLILSFLPMFRDLIGRSIDSNTVTLTIYPLSFLCVFLFFSLFPKDFLNKNFLKLFFYCILFSSFFFMLFYFFKVKSTPTPSLTYRSSIFAHVYLPLGLFPFSFLLFEKKERWFIISFLIIFVVVSNKGTPLVSFLLLGLFAFFGICKFKIQTSILIVALFASAVCAVLLIDLFVLNGRIINLILDESALIRLEGYKTIIQDVANFTPFEWFFGKGVSATIELRGLAAHNDYIEYFYDYGLIGLAAFLVFVSSFVFCCLPAARKGGSFLTASVSLLAFAFPITMLSAIFTNTNMLLFASAGALFNGNFVESLSMTRGVDFEYTRIRL